MTVLYKKHVFNLGNNILKFSCFIICWYIIHRSLYMKMCSCLSILGKKIFTFFGIKKFNNPHMCGKTYWIHSLLQIVTYECTTARINGAKPLTIDAWQCFLFDIRDCIKEWLLCFYCPSLSPSLLTGLWDIEYVSDVLFCYILNVMLC